jgi:outer membrane receptor protein involved in Fe transport
MLKQLCCVALAAPGIGYADANPATADSRLEEVVVSAQLRPQTALETPASVTVLSQDTLQAVGQQHLQDVLALVPNLNWAAGTSRPRYFQLRGVGELDQWQGAPNPSVGFLIDDVDFSGIGTTATLFDVEQVEVVRGPQGVAYGANALAGLIAMRTREPSTRLGARAELSAGDYGLVGAGGVITGPLAEDGSSAFRLAVQRQRSDGFRRNPYLGRNDTNGYDETTLRGKVRVEPRADLTLNLSAFWLDADNGYDAFAIDNSRNTLSDKPGRDAQQSRGGAITIDYRGFERAALRSVTTYAKSDIDYSFDGDWGNPESWGVNGPYDFEQRFDRQRDVATQDLRVTSAADAAAWSWLVGAYGSRLTERNSQRDFFNGDTTRSLDSQYRADNVALYGETSWSLGERTRATVGWRGERREAEYRDNEGQAFGPSESMWGATATLRYALQSSVSLYASVGRGYKAGGFNIGAAIPDERREFDAERLESVELGINGRSSDGRFDGSVAVFSMRRADQQVESSVQLVPGDPLTFVFFTDNAARGENAGIEAQARWRLSSRVSTGGSASWLRARFTEYDVGGRNLRGRDQPHAPRYQFAAFGEYRHPRGWFARADVTGTDAFYFSASHEERSASYVLRHLKLGYTASNWSAELWVRNAFDQYYSQRGFFFGNEPPDFPNKRYLQAGDPRQIGVTVRHEFRD